MVHIALYDTDQDNIKSMTKAVRRYVWARSGPYTAVLPFCSAEALLHDLTPLQVCVFYAREDRHGDMEIAAALQKKHPGLKLVFCSERGCSSQALAAYRMRAVQYVVGSPEGKAFSDALDQAMKELPGNHCKRVVINTTKGLTNVRLAELLYAKSAGHRIYFYLKNGEVLESKCMRIPFGSIVSDMLEEGFFRCHDSYVLNLNYAVQLTPEGAVLPDGTTVPVSTKKRASLRELLPHA